MATYLTPGVYVEEIPKFPPSVAPVATAIPAFIGYTEKDDLKLKATRIESLVDFEQLFGGQQLETDITVSINETSAAGGKPATSVDSEPRPPSAPSTCCLRLQLFYERWQYG
jgi:phage tail sheath protein FI